MLRFAAVTSKRLCPRGLALFLCLGAASCSPGEPISSPGAGQSCLADTTELEQRRVERVVDGDTLRLVGGDSVRLIGVNTPEMARDGKADEPLARSAQQALADMLPSGRVWLQDGEEARDRHGRRLAYAFDESGASLSGHLIASGLGFHIAVAPNDRYAGCLQGLEAASRASRVGVWGEPRFTARRVSELRADEGGFLRVRDRVTRVSFKQNGWWVQLGGKLGVQIDGPVRSQFSRDELRALDGREVEVRGWLIPMRGGWWMMNLGHPAMLQAGDEAG